MTETVVGKEQHNKSRYTKELHKQGNSTNLMFVPAE